MNDEQLLEALGRLARDSDTFDQRQQRFERFTAGTLAAAELAELQAEAATSPQVAAALEAYRPLGSSFEAAMVERLSGLLADEASAGECIAPATPSERVAAATVAESTVVPFRPRARVIVPLAMAASVLIAIGLLSVQPPGSPAASLPGYAIQIGGDLSQVRSWPDTPESTAALAFASGNRMRLVLTPDTAVAGDIDARLAVIDGDKLSWLDTPPAQVSAAGAVLIEGEVGAQIMLPAEPDDLFVVLSRPDAEPAAAEMLRAFGTDSVARGKDWQAWRIVLVAE